MAIMEKLARKNIFFLHRRKKKMFIHNAPAEAAEATKVAAVQSMIKRQAKERADCRFYSILSRKIALKNLLSETLKMCFRRV